MILENQMKIESKNRQLRGAQWFSSEHPFPQIKKIQEIPGENNVIISVSIFSLNKENISARNLNAMTTPQKEEEEEDEDEVEEEDQLTLLFLTSLG